MFFSKIPLLGGNFQIFSVQKLDKKEKPCIMQIMGQESGG